jgi:hypothetical protein
MNKHVLPLSQIAALLQTSIQYVESMLKAGVVTLHADAVFELKASSEEDRKKDIKDLLELPEDRLFQALLLRRYPR